MDRGLESSADCSAESEMKRWGKKCGSQVLKESGL